MRPAFRLALFVTSLLAPFTTYAQIDGGGFDGALFDRFVSMRTGDGDPVYWYSIGTLRASTVTGLPSENRASGRKVNSTHSRFGPVSIVSANSP